MPRNQTNDPLDSTHQDKDLRGNSRNWANWMSELKLNSCKLCVKKHGTIVDLSLLNSHPEVPVLAHPNGKCLYVPMRTKKAGTATTLAYNGADAQVLYLNRLPDYYVSKEQAQKAGWETRKGNLHKVLPGKMIGGDIYQNREGKLPRSPGRVWHESDINYDKGFRNHQRVLYSNDGLVFATYDHYHTFYEIIK